MKVIKKIAAIMFALVMVISMGANVSVAHAEEGAQTGTKGKITINDAVDGQIYTIYKMLDLESYDPENGLYSYKPASEAWKTFFADGKPGHDYATINENGYITWTDKSKVEETEDEKKVRLEKEAAELAQKALAYAKDTNNHITATGEKKANGTTVKFSELDLGYYLVDSSLGTLCGLDTTNPTVTIKEKNDVPTVDKKIDISTQTNEILVDKSSANLGEVVVFKTTINVQPGAYNYVLHDEMDSNLENPTLWTVADNGTDNYRYVSDQDFQFISNPTGGGCTFELKFLDNFYKNRAELINQKKVTTITIQYYATVKDSAPINTAMENKAWLTYGDNNTESNKPVTKTYTYGIHVFKYTKKNDVNTGLAGAKFSLYTDNNNAVGSIINFKNNGNEYRYTEDTEGTTKTLQSPTDGNFYIKGLKAGTYWLKETEAPKGYNTLVEPIKIIIEQNTDGTQSMKNVKGDVITKVEVENKSGSILPSTGGMGTTIFYIAGAFLVLISGVVLIAKKRTDSK